MLRKIGLLLLGVLTGVILVCVWRPHAASYDPKKIPPESESVDLDAVYDQLQQEQRPNQEEKYWFDQRVDTLNQDAEDSLQKMQEQGNDAAKVFEQFMSDEQ